MPRDYGEIIYNYNKITYPTAGLGAAGGSILCKTSSGALAGIMVTAAANTPTLAVYDDNTRVSTGTVILASFTPVAGTMYWFGRPLQFQSGLYVASSGSVGCTISYL